jgi:ADP-heptose:LPS heptosyltransferase
MINTTNLTFSNFQDQMLYNPSCLKEMERFSQFCTDFRIDIINSVTTRFKIIIFLLVILITIKIYIDNKQPKFSQTQFYQEKVKYRIDFIIMITAICTIGLMFI